MANAKECDRCGKLYKGPICEQSYFIRKVGSIAATMDICPECNDELVAWFDRGKSTDEDTDSCYGVKEPIRFGYDVDRDEQLYQCPYCAEAIGSKALRSQKGCGEYRCPHCYKLLDYKEDSDNG